MIVMVMTGIILSLLYVFVFNIFKEMLEEYWTGLAGPFEFILFVIVPLMLLISSTIVWAIGFLFL